MEVGDRRKFRRKQNLCFGCYEPISKDLCGRNCPKRKICYVCKRNHSTRMHAYKPKSKESVTGGSQGSEKKSTDCARKIACASTTIPEDVISMCVVPVRKNHTTFALEGLKVCSQLGSN